MWLFFSIIYNNLYLFVYMSGLSMIDNDNIYSSFVFYNILYIGQLSWWCTVLCTGYACSDIDQKTMNPSIKFYY